jgi:hypothetical protein
MVNFFTFANPIAAFVLGSIAILTFPFSRVTDILGGILFGIGLCSLILSIARERFSR